VYSDYRLTQLMIARRLWTPPTTNTTVIRRVATTTARSCCTGRWGGRR